MLTSWFYSKSYADVIRVIGLPTFQQTSFPNRIESGIETILTDMAERRKLRSERSEEWDEEDREATFEVSGAG